MIKNYDNILGKIYDTPWLITKPGLELIIDIVEKRMAGESLTENELARIRMDGSGTNSAELELPTTPSVAVLPVNGSIFPKANLMTSLSGGTSSEKLGSDFKTLVESDMVTAIVLNVDSPGGSAEGIKELADTIYAARGKKPIYAVSNFKAASGAYYIASQADKFYSTDSGQVGSIGVVAVHTETSERDATSGVKRTILTVGKYKAEGNPYEPLSDDAKAHHLDQMQEIYDQFVSDVARGRGVSTDTVNSDYGQGRVYRAKTALKRGMIDGIKTLDAVVGEASESNSTSVAFPNVPSAMGGNKMEPLSSETLELLGLSEDATNEEISSAIADAVKKANTPAPAITAPPVTNDPEFAVKYPEVAAEMSRLRRANQENTASMFAASYERFSSEEKGNTGFGLSAIALDAVSDLHLKISDGLITHDDLKSFLDMVASQKAVVDYRELGSNREGDKETEDVQDGRAAAEKLRDMALAKATEEGSTYGDALSKVMSENPELTKLYNASVASPERGEN